MDELAELRAEREIRFLLARYAHLADDNAVDDWADLFTENGSLVAAGTRTAGRDDLRAWLVGVQNGRPMRHLVVNSAITVDGAERAHGVSDLLLLGRRDGRWVVVAAPRYSDTFAKVEGRWLFAERILDAHDPTG